MPDRTNAEPAAQARPRQPKREAHRVVFVTGKGGVGKSVVAAATALKLAREGQKVLLVELGSRSFYGPLLGLEVGTEAMPWKPNIGVARWDADTAIREYMGHYLVFKAAANRVLDHTLMKALVAAAPAVAEIAILGKLTAPMRHRWVSRDVDAVVVDAYSTGQFMALLRAPRGLAQTALSGPMHRHTTTIMRLLSDPAACEYRLVTLAEELPIAEACEMAHAMREETGIAPGIWLNRLLEMPARMPAVPTGSPAGSFVAQMTRIAERQRHGIAALEALGADRAGGVHRLPLIPTTDVEVLLSGLADALDAKPGVRR